MSESEGPHFPSFGKIVVGLVALSIALPSIEMALNHLILPAAILVGLMLVVTLLWKRINHW